MKTYIEWMTDKGIKKNAAILDDPAKFVVGARPNFLCSSMIFQIPSQLLPYANWTMIYYQLGRGVDLGCLLSIIAGHLVGYENLFCSQPTYDDLQTGMHKAVAKYDFEQTYKDTRNWRGKKKVVSYPLKSPYGTQEYLDVKKLPMSQWTDDPNTKNYDFSWALGCGPVIAPLPYGMIAFDPTMGPHAKQQQTEAEAKQFADAHERYLKILVPNATDEEKLMTAKEIGLSMRMCVPMKSY